MAATRAVLPLVVPCRGDAVRARGNGQCPGHEVDGWLDARGRPDGTVAYRGGAPLGHGHDVHARQRGQGAQDQRHTRCGPTRHGRWHIRVAEHQDDVLRRAGVAGWGRRRRDERFATPRRELLGEPGSLLQPTLLTCPWASGGLGRAADRMPRTGRGGGVPEQVALRKWVRRTARRVPGVRPTTVSPPCPLDARGSACGERRAVRTRREARRRRTVPYQASMAGSTRRKARSDRPTCAGWCARRLCAGWPGGGGAGRGAPGLRARWAWV